MTEELRDALTEALGLVDRARSRLQIAVIDEEGDAAETVDNIAGDLIDIQRRMERQLRP